MADYRAIASVCEAVIDLLRSNCTRDLFNKELQFKVFCREDFSSAMEAGVSVFLYRVFHNGTNRHPRRPVNENGEKELPQLPLDIHFLLTAWAKAASLQNTITGWMMRVLEDNAILKPGLLNNKWPAFSPDETVEISLAKLSTEDIFRIWETLTQDKYQLSIPYVARNIRIDSSITKTMPALVNDRELIFLQKKVNLK